MIVISPTDRWVKDALKNCSSSLAVSSPYVGKYLDDAVSQLGPKVAVTLLTRTLLGDFASNASDMDAVQSLAEQSAESLASVLFTQKFMWSTRSVR